MKFWRGLVYGLMIVTSFATVLVILGYFGIVGTLDRDDAPPLLIASAVSLIVLSIFASRLRARSTPRNDETPL